MKSYRYAVSLRLWHPRRDLSGATKAIGLKPARIAMAGEERKTPKGTKLAGVWPESYWLAKLTPPKGISSRQLPFERFMLRTLNRLALNRAYIIRNNASGGHAELFVGLFGSGNLGIEFQPDLLAKASRVGLALTLDIYP